MAKKKHSKSKQTNITSTALPLLKRPLEQKGKDIKVPGAYWEGRMSAEEKATEYKCTVREYEALHKWDDGRPPSAAFQLQEMGVAGTGSLEHGDASGEIFWMTYPMPYLKYHYNTFPEDMPDWMPADSSDDRPAGDATGAAGEKEPQEQKVFPLSHGGIMHPDFPALKTSSAPVIQFFKINSDTLVEAGPKSGKFRTCFECNIKMSDSRVCGRKREIYHDRYKAVSTSNLINHLKEMKDSCEVHAEALKQVQEGSSKYVVVDGELVKKYDFKEAFTHHVDMLWLRAAGISAAMVAREEFQEYVRGYDARATFPHNEIIHRLATVVNVLQKEERMQRIQKLKAQFKGKPCLGLQLDMWTDSNTHTAYACVTMTTVLEPKETRAPNAQLFLRSEILDFNIFPNTEKTGENIKAWFLSVLSAQKIDHSLVSGITPDGAADGQCGLAMIPSLAEKVDTCLLHQLQRAVLFSIGLAGSSCKNEAAKALLRKNNRLVMLSRQSLAVNKGIKEAQVKAGVPSHQVHTLVPTATTRWGNQFRQISMNNLLRIAIDPAVEKFKKDNKGNKEAIVEPNESDQGSKVGKPVSAAELGLSSDDWEDNQELEAFLSYPFDLKETIEHKGFCTGAQALMLLYDLKENFCNSNAMLEMKALPITLKMADRERACEMKKASDLSVMTDEARAELKEQLEARCFKLRSSNARMIQLYMSKQQDVKDMLSSEQYDLAKTLYLQALRGANDIVKLPTHESSPRKAQKATGGAKLFRGKALLDNGTADSLTANTPADGYDGVNDEIERWERLSEDAYSEFFDETDGGDGLLNEFKMMWALRERFPLHFIVFKQIACHLAHEANVEQVFSRAGNLSDPNIDPEFLMDLVMTAVNKKAFKPTLQAIKDKYYELYRGKGGGEDEDFVVETQAQPVAQGEAGPSGA